MENRRASDPASYDQLEKNDTQFTTFAYGSHADAFLSAGLEDLNIFDLARGALTPDVADLVTEAGLQQGAEIGIRLLPLWAIFVLSPASMLPPVVTPHVWAWPALIDENWTGSCFSSPWMGFCPEQPEPEQPEIITSSTKTANCVQWLSTFLLRRLQDSPL
jgi:hypothetical protein